VSGLPPDVCPGIAKGLRQHQALAKTVIAETHCCAQEGTTSYDPVAGLVMALALVLCDHRRTGVQPGDLSLGLDMGNSPPAYSRILMSLDEVCAPDSPYRSMLPRVDRDKWEKSKSSSGQ